MRTTRTLLVGIATGATALVGFGTAASAATKAHSVQRASSSTIVIGNEGFTESDIMQYIYGDLLQNIGYKVSYKSTGSRQDAIPALEAGKLDVVPDYAGSLLLYLNKTATKAAGSVTTAEQGINAALKSKGAVALPGTAGLDQNVFVVTQATKAKYHLTDISSIKSLASNWIFGAPPECSANYFCLPGLEKVYGLKFKKVTSLDDSGPVSVKALQTNAAQVVELFSTDNVISADKFYVLTDDKGLEPADHLIPVIRTSLDNAKVQKALESVNALLTTSVLTQLDAAASTGTHPTPQAIAQGFLQEEKLIKS